MIAEQIQLNRSRISVGSGCVEEVLGSIELDGYSSIAIISQARIWELHGDKLDFLGLRTRVGAAPRLKLLEDGESIKSLTTFAELLGWLADQRLDRRGLLLILGGGVVGDLSGFVASAYMRGIDWMYIPTTLLAQQDASIGGKVGVNLAQGKNLAGHFWEPREVIIDTDVLATLPTRECHAGFMELLKHGILDGGPMFEQICRIPVTTRDWHPHLPLLLQGLKVKARIVAEDPFERGPRRLLNLGHTLGHALETFSGYGTLLHGEAVGIGLLFAALTAGQLGSRFDWSTLFETVVSRLPPLDTRAWDADHLLELTRLDKKGVKGEVAWIIPHEPGRVEIITGVEFALLRAALVQLIARLG